MAEKLQPPVPESTQAAEQYNQQRQQQLNTRALARWGLGSLSIIEN